MKSVSTSAVRRKICEAGLYCRTAVKKSPLRKQNNVRRIQWDKAHKDWTIEQWNKVLLTDESKFKIFGLNRSLYTVKSWWKSCITPTGKHGGGSFMVQGLLPIAKSWICAKLTANWIRPAITAYCSILQSHLERGLWVKDLYSCKIMTQIMQVNSTRGTLKAKCNCTSFNWCLSQRN